MDLEPVDKTDTKQIVTFNILMPQLGSDLRDYMKYFTCNC